MDDTYKVKFSGFNPVKIEAYSEADAIKKAAQYFLEHGWTISTKNAHVELLEVS